MVQDFASLQAEYDEFMTTSQEMEELLETRNNALQEQLNQALDDMAKLRDENTTLVENKRRLEQTEEELTQSRYGAVRQNEPPRELDFTGSPSAVAP